MLRVAVMIVKCLIATTMLVLKQRRGEVNYLKTPTFGYKIIFNYLKFYLFINNE